MRLYHFSGVLFIVVGLLLIVIPHWMFPVCDFTPDGLPDGGHMKCYWMAKAEIAFGLLLAVCGLLFLTVKDMRVECGLAMAAIATTVFAALTGVYFIGGCDNDRMTCNIATLPSMIQVLGVAFVAGIFALFSLRRYIREDNERLDEIYRIAEAAHRAEQDKISAMERSALLEQRLEKAEDEKHAAESEKRAAALESNSPDDEQK